MASVADGIIQASVDETERQRRGVDGGVGVRIAPARTVYDTIMFQKNNSHFTHIKHYNKIIHHTRHSYITTLWPFVIIYYYIMLCRYQCIFFLKQ